LACLDNIKGFGRTAMGMASITLLVNALVFFGTPLYTVGRAIPSTMLMVIGYLGYTGRTSRKAEVVFTYLTFYGIGLFASGIILLIHYEFYAWEYYIVAPMGLVLAFLGLSVRDGRGISRRWWVLLTASLMILILFSVHEIISLATSDQISSLTYLGRLARELCLIGNGCLLYFTLSGDVKDKVQAHF